MTEGRRVGTRTRRAVGLASLAPVVGLFLLMPPFITVFTAERAVYGVPLIIVYVFGAWLGLIAVAAFAARRLHRTPTEGG